MGASGGDVARRIVGQALRLTGLGIVLGVIGTLAPARLLGSLLFGVETLDPGNLSAVVGLAVGVAILGSYVPARRASRVDPIAAGARRLRPARESASGAAYGRQFPWVMGSWLVFTTSVPPALASPSDDHLAEGRPLPSPAVEDAR